jgi:hypothetical protein
MAESRTGGFHDAKNSASGFTPSSRVGQDNVTDEEFNSFSPADKLAHVNTLINARPAARPAAATSSTPEEPSTPTASMPASKMGDVRAHPQSGQRQVLSKIGRDKTDWVNEDQPSEEAKPGQVKHKGFYKDPESLSPAEMAEVKARVGAENQITLPRGESKRAYAEAGATPDANTGLGTPATKVTARQRVQQEAAALGKPTHKPTEVEAAHNEHIGILEAHIKNISAKAPSSPIAASGISTAQALLNKAKEKISIGRGFLENRVESDGKTRRFPQAHNKQLQIAGNLILAAHKTLNEPEVIAHAGDKPPLNNENLSAWSERANQLPTTIEKGRAPKAFKVNGRKFDFRDPGTAMAIAEIHHEVENGNPSGIDPELLKAITPGGTRRVAPEDREAYRAAGVDPVNRWGEGESPTSAPSKRADRLIDPVAATRGSALIADGAPFATSVAPPRPGDSSATIAADEAAPRAEGASPIVEPSYRPTKAEAKSGSRPSLIPLDREGKTGAAAGRVAADKAEADKRRAAVAAQDVADKAGREAEYAARDAETLKATGRPSVRQARTSSAAREALQQAAEGTAAGVAERNSKQETRLEAKKLEDARPGSEKGSMDKPGRKSKPRAGKLRRSVDEGRRADIEAKKNNGGK